MHIQISDKEQSRIRPAKEYYTEQGHDVEVTNLEIGDYLFDDQVVYEYKTIPDFVSSIQDKRIFNEPINQAENYSYHFVIIQGNEAERSKTLAMTRHYQPVSIFQYLGVISSLNRYTTVIECYSPYIKEAFYRMESQARKCLSDKPIVKRHGKKSKNMAFNILCNDIYGINWKKAKLIVDAYELKSLHDLTSLTYEELCVIDGIGEKTARNILEAIHGSTD